MKTKLLVPPLISAALLVFASLLLSQDRRLIKPVKDPKDAAVTPSLYPELSSLAERERKLIEKVYVSAFWDGLTLAQIRPSIVKELFSADDGMDSADDGMDIEQVADTMHRFYADNPQWRETKPSVLIAGVIPRLRKRQKPFPDTR
jgi:hypothetical protein